MTAMRGACFAAAAAALLLGAAYVGVRYYHLHDAIAHWWHGRVPGTAWNRAPSRHASLWLPDYAFDIEGLPVEGVDRNLSGLEFDRANGHLLAVVNRPPEVLVLDTDGRVLRRHPVIGASDVEALVVLEGDTLLLLQEGRRALVRARLPARDGAPVRADPASRVPLSMPGPSNSGPEGMAYDATRDTLYIAKESAPVALYTVSGLRAGRPAQRDLGAWLRPLHFASDLSALAFDPASGHLLLLSDQSQLVAELDARGAPVSWASLRDKATGMPAPQPEGLAIDDAGTLYMASEPNLFYRMRRRR